MAEPDGVTRDSYADRRDRLRAILAEHQVPVALVSRLVNVRYLSGFTGSNGALLIRADGADLFGTDDRYAVQAEQQVPDLERVIDRKLLAALADRATQADLVTRAGSPRLAVETHDLTVDQLTTLHDDRPGLSTPSLEQAAEGLREVKDAAELAHLRTACAISCAALEGLFETRLAGRTEVEIARDLEARMYAEGAEAIGFPTIVAAGINGASPHHEPTSRPVEAGELLTIDFGARCAGYHADCTRTVMVGAQPSGWQREVYDAVRSANRAGARALVTGAERVAVDRAAREVIEAAGYGEAFSHGLGHGVGLEIHEEPYLSWTATGKLQERTPVTVEPGVYLPGRGGIRIEDTLVTTSGSPEVLTPTTTDLLVLD